jgi:fatty acid desaturase
MDLRDDLPRGLVFFSRRASPGHKRRRLGFAALLLAAALALIWPLYTLFSGPFPLILGLPLSLAWVVLWLVLVFLGLLWQYQGDRNQDRKERE